ncbi:MAG: hypothetical protein JWQ96_1181 [Segetibacter sp.]|nr:hypothetical protein [Segetibacter sp.]
MLFKWWNGLFLYQLQPSLFNNRFDLFTWLFMKTGIHQWLPHNSAGWVLFDVTFYALPGLFLFTYIKSLRASVIVAFLMLLVNWTYIQTYTLYPTNSIESYTAWLLFPLLFLAINLKSFYLIFHGLRYFFLFFFASAGVWKLVQGGVFYTEEMSGVLLYQHKEYLTSSPNYWYSDLIYGMIIHPAIGYGLYIAGTVLELVFIIGFFTRKYDKVLIAAFITFLVMDVLIMRINYFETLPFVLTLYYSRKSFSAIPPALLIEVD